MDDDEFSDTSQILNENDSIFEDLPDLDDSVNSDALMDLSHSECAEFAAPTSSAENNETTSSPRRSTRKKNPVNRLEIPPGPSLVHRPKSASTASRKNKSNGRLKCPKCPGTYANKRTLDIHLRGHLMAGVTSRLPDVSQLRNEMPGFLKRVISEIGEEKPIGEFWTDMQKTCQEILPLLDSDSTGSVEELCSILSESFHKILITNKKLMFPSALRSTVYVGTNRLLSCTEFIPKVAGLIEMLHEMPGPLLNVLVSNIVFQLSKLILILCMRVMRNCEGEVAIRRKRSADSIEDPTFRKLVYHIGGATIHSFVWKGKKYSETSKAWTKIVAVLETQFIASPDKQNECQPEVRKLTESKDRGGLTHMSDAAFSFFLVLFDLLMCLEGDDGSMPPNVIDEHVLSSDVVLCLWDVIVGENLSPDESLDLLIQIAQTCIRVVMKGIMKRRLNKYLKKAYSSVALRPGLAKN